jgi:hypothetical protein
MRSLLLLSIATAACSAEPGYVDPRACRPCHQKIFDSYQQTGMARSFAKVTDVPVLREFEHPASKQRFSVVNRGGTAYLRRSQPILERSMDYAIGSGQHARTFVHRDAGGRLTELPVSWYSEGGGSWHMSPGYDREKHSGFQREASDSCLFCHNGYPSDANGGTAQGLDCQRCHGPGESHVNGKGAIVNPAKLGPERQIEVCLQCHLESASRTLPDAIRRFGRSAFSYRPGEPLSAFMLYFEFVSAPQEERITVNGSAYGLMKSKCFLRSAGRLQCTTCHDPHTQIGASESEAHYTRACRSCHGTSHSGSRMAMGNCVDCHMQKRRTEDAVHVVMTDHLIRRQPLNKDSLAMIAEAHDRLSGPVELLYPRTLPDSSEIAVYRAMANGDSAALERTIGKANPQYPEPYLALAEALGRAGRVQEAIRYFRRVIDLAPGDPRAYLEAADLMLATNQLETALDLILPALRRAPEDSRLLNSAAVLYASQGRFDEALALTAKAVAMHGEDSLSWLNLGVCLEAKGDHEGASNAYQQALTLDPNSSRAAEFLRRMSAASR